MFHGICRLSSPTFSCNYFFTLKPLTTMAKVTFSTDIQSISGKLCSKEGVIYSVNQQTGKTYRSDRHGYSDPKTEEQQTIRATFKKKSQFASAWWKQNRPSSTSANGTDAYVAVMKAYKAQHKIGNP